MIRTRPAFDLLRTGIVVFLLSSISFPAFSQTEVSYRRGATQLEDILPPSPEAASRVKYSDVPFTHSMGAAEYSVPVYELKGRRLTIPISLDYCSNGIKLDEIAGVAGLGWTLNAGGCITREVVFMPDEFEDGMFRYTWPGSTVLQGLLSRSTDNATIAFLRDVAWNLVDTNSDRYSYSVMGLRGQFILDPDGNVIQLQGDGVDISWAPETVDGKEEKVFTIVGPDGTVFTFGDRERGTRKDQYREPTYSSGQQVDWDATTAMQHQRLPIRRQGSTRSTTTLRTGPSFLQAHRPASAWPRQAKLSPCATPSPARRTRGRTSASATQTSARGSTARPSPGGLCRIRWERSIMT